MVSAANGFSNTAVSAVAIGDEHACAIEGGKLWCWGSAFISGQWGVLGNGGGTATTPALVSANGDFHNSGTSGDMVTAVSANYARTCAIEGGQTFCWGNNNALQLGLGSNSSNPINVPSRVVDTATPELQAATATKLTDGFFHTCAIASGSLYCWGMNGDSQLGNTSPAQGVPVKVAQGGFTSSNSNITDVDAGNYQTCAVQSGKAFCWGQNSSGQLGTGNTTASSTPVAVQSTGSFANSGSVSSVTSGEDHSCAIDNGKLFCWGINTWRQLGDGTTNDSTSPVMVAASDVPGFNNTAVTAVSAGEQHTCAIENKVVYCWGGNSSYQLGNNSFYPEDKPVKVFVVSAPAAPTISVMAGSSGTLSVGVNKPNDGGSTITSYEYQVDSGSPVTVAFDGYNYQTITISGLTNGTSYSVKVRAVNAIGTGSWSAPSSGTPSAGSGGGGGIGGGGGSCSGGANLSPSSQSASGTVGQSMIVPAPIASGFTSAPTFSLASGSFFPSGLTLNQQTGGVTGTPTAAANSMTAGINVTNGSQSCFYSITFSIVASGGGGGSGGGIPTCTTGSPSITGMYPGVDSSFGTGGWSRIAPSGVSRFESGTLVMTSEPNNVRNLLLISGITPTGSDARLDIRKFDQSGAAVSAFGTSGVLQVDVSSNPETRIRVIRAEVDTAGSITVFGKYDRSNGASVNFVARLTSTGTVDTSFNANGVVEISGATGMSVAPDGSVVAVGNTGPSFWAKRYSSTGTLDVNFGGGGSITSSTKFIPAAFNSDGSFFLARTDAGQMKIVKYDSSGVVVSGWASGEKVVGDPTANESALRMRVVGQSLYLLHKVEVAGSGSNPPIATWRVAKVDLSNNNGDLVQGFGSSGIAISPSYTGTPTEFTVQTSGDIVVWGYYYDSFGPTAALIRFSSSGQIDSTFATDPTRLYYGTCSLSFGYQDDSSIAIIEDANGKFLIAAQEFPSGGGSIVANQLGRLDFLTQNTGGSSGGGSSGGGSAPTLVTSANQSLLERDPGSEGMIINGQPVSIDTTRVEISAARTPAAQRTPAQVAAIQAAGLALLQEFLASLPAGAVTNVTVVNTTTGAVMQNLVFDGSGNSVDVPVEDIVILDGPSLSLMIGSNNANITSDGKYQIGAGGIVGVVGAGLGANAPGEIVAMSTPTLLANFTTSANGDLSQSAQLPNSIGVGDHTLVVATGSTYAVMGLRVVPSALPTTGLSDESGRTMVIALFTMVFAAVLVRSRRLTLLAR